MEKEASMPAAGSKAPLFNALAHTGDSIRLSRLKGQWVVLYFYPKDDTPGCTIEAQEFRDAQSAFIEANARVLGVSPDDVASHCRFVEKQGLNFLLLADTDQSLAGKYGVWVEKNMYGRKYMGVQRATFLINPAGVIAQVWPKVKAKGHAREVLDAITALAD